jgi:hypothetical protein
MVLRAQRVFTLATSFERDVAMAVERAKLGDYLVDTPEDQEAHVLSRVLRLLAKATPEAARRAVEPLGSAYLDEFLKAEERIARTSS